MVRNLGILSVKTIVRRPTLHYVIMAAYVLAPVGNVLLVSIFGDIPLSIVIRRLTQGYGLLATVWLLTAPVVGLSLFLVNRLTWYLFIAHSLLILGDFVYKWVDRPQFYMETIDGALNMLLVLGNLGLVGMVLYIIQRDFRSPYFQVLQRSFREAKRIPLEHTVQIAGTTAKITDLSSTGCFVAAPNLALPADGRVSIGITAGELDLLCQAKVMRKTDAGYGLMFVGLRSADRDSLRQLLRQRYTLRYRVDLPAVWHVELEPRDVIIVNMSAGGCYVSTIDAEEPPSLTDDTAVALDIRIGSHSAKIAGRIAWTNPHGEFGKAAGFGVAFARNQRRLVRQAVDQYGKLELTR